MDFDLFDIKNDVDFEVIALRSTLPEYKLAYQLNRSLKVQLVRCENDLDLIEKKQTVCFATYQYFDEENQKGLCLLRNNTLNKVVEKEITLFEENTKEEKLFLIPELLEFDYILKNYGYDSKKITTKIRLIPNIQVIKKVEISNIKSIHHLIF